MGHISPQARLSRTVHQLSIVLTREAMDTITTASPTDTNITSTPMENSPSPKPAVPCMRPPRRMIPTSNQMSVKRHPFFVDAFLLSW